MGKANEIEFIDLFEDIMDIASAQHLDTPCFSAVIKALKECNSKPRNISSKDLFVKAGSPIECRKKAAKFALYMSILCVVCFGIILHFVL